MTRRCDNCEKIIPLGSNYIDVGLGTKEASKLFGTSHLDFCSLKCLVVYWSNKKNIGENKNG